MFMKAIDLFSSSQSLNLPISTLGQYYLQDVEREVVFHGSVNASEKALVRMILATRKLGQ